MLIVPQGLKSKRIEHLTLEEMDWLARGEHMCRKLGVVLMCPICLSNGTRVGALLRGQNDESDRVMKVECDHREMVFQVRD